MRPPRPTIFAMLAAVYWFTAGCKATPASPGCVPGKSEACVGPNGCAGFQECAADGRAFGTCACTAPASIQSAARTQGTAVGEPSKAPEPSEPGASPQATDDFFTYTNGRFGFRLDVPKAFKAHEPPTNGDGQGWSGDDGVELSAAGMLDGEGFWSGFDESKAKLAPDAYVKKGQDWYVLSWKDGQNDTITYEKCNLRKDKAASACMTLTFPATKKVALDASVTRMSRTFRFEGASLQ